MMGSEFNRRVGNGSTAVAHAKRGEGASLRFALRSVDEDDLAVLERFDLHQLLVRDGGAVARFDADAVHLDAALRRNEITVAFRAELVLGDVTGLERGAENAGGRPDRQRVVVSG